MFVQSEKCIEAHAGRLGDIAIDGEESNYNDWRRDLKADLRRTDGTSPAARRPPH